MTSVEVCAFIFDNCPKSETWDPWDPSYRPSTDDPNFYWTHRDEFFYDILKNVVTIKNSGKIKVQYRIERTRKGFFIN